MVLQNKAAPSTRAAKLLYSLPPSPTEHLPRVRQDKFTFSAIVILKHFWRYPVKHCDNCNSQDCVIVLEVFVLLEEATEAEDVLLCSECLTESTFWCETHKCQKVLMFDPGFQEDPSERELFNACSHCMLERSRGFSEDQVEDIKALLKSEGDQPFLDGLLILSTQLIQAALTDEERYVFVLVMYCELFSFEFDDCLSSLVVHLNGATIQ
jgi:hypothetical protein